MFKWFNQKGYYQGVFFALMFLSLGPSLDAVTKLLGTRLPQLEIIFFRFLFSLISLIIYVIVFKQPIVKTKYIKLNITRGVLGYFSFVGCVYSVTILPLSEVTIIFWTMPFFVLILSAIILKEKVSKNRWIATILGFSGLYFFICPTGISFQIAALIPVFAAFAFATQDIIIKRMVDNDDNRVTMMFYFSLVTTVLGIGPALYVWTSPNSQELLYLFILGVSANLMQYLIFKAFTAASVSALAPFRYVEVIIAALFDYLLFGIAPSVNTYLSAIVIIPATLYLIYSEEHSKKLATS